MAKVYSAPEEIKVPEFNFRDLKTSRENEKNYIEQIKEFAKKNSKDQYAGEEISIPHADGYARYIVFKSKPVNLIHLPIGDAWDAPLAHRLLTKDVVEMVNRAKSLSKLFS